MMTDTLTEFVAHIKSPDCTQSLADHLQGVASRAACFSKKLGLSVPGRLIGLLHDLGKYSTEFQAYIKSAGGLLDQDADEDYVDAQRLRGTIDHSSAGAQLIWRELGAQGVIEQWIAQILALCVASHHSGLIDCIGADQTHMGEDVFSRRMNKRDERTHLTEAWKNADPDIRQDTERLLVDRELVDAMRTRMVHIAQRAGDDPTTGIIATQHMGLLTRFLFSCLIDADRLDTAIFEKPKANQHREHGDYVAWPVLIDRLEAHLAGLVPTRPVDGLRRQISDECLQAAARDKGICTLTVPTGGGKTLASLRYALHHAHKHHMERIIYIIPFTSIIDQNAEVVRGILENESDAGCIVLEHHGNLTPEQQSWREKMLTENWDAPVIYTTMVQFLEALFGAGTRGARRMHQLANSVLIFDEVQSLPVRCVHLFNNAINFLVDHCHASVVLCTATQPLLGKVDKRFGALALGHERELIADVGGLFSALRRVQVIDQRRPGGWCEEDIASLAIREVGESGSCLVIVNTRKTAGAIYERCRDTAELPVIHLSTRLCPAHRKTLLHEIRDRLARKLPVLCISTQLIEAGVDVDFGAVVRCTAGLDAIAQAAGRCNRHGERPIGRVHVVNLADENLDRLPDIAIGRDKAARVLDDFAAVPENYDSDLLGPKAMHWYYENYFYARSADMHYSVSAATLGHDDTLLQLLGENRQASESYGRQRGAMPPLRLRQAFMTAARVFKAIGSPTQAVIVPYGKAGTELINNLCAAFDVDKQYELLRRAQQYSVNVFSHELNTLQLSGAVQSVQVGSQILYLDSRHYHPELGLVTEPTQLMDSLTA